MLTVKSSTAKIGLFRHLEVAPEGRLVAEWAKFLAREIVALERRSLPIVLDLTGVTEVDTEGLEVITKLVDEGVQVVGLPSVLAHFAVETALAC